jgi:hypothetical protein
MLLSNWPWCNFEVVNDCIIEVPVVEVNISLVPGVKTRHSKADLCMAISRKKEATKSSQYLNGDVSNRARRHRVEVDYCGHW